jgi:2-hydroxy-6-oxonona-2,4-dienedioate hydrolase
MSLWGEMLGSEVRFYTTRSGVKTRCIRMGSGTPLVFLTGMTGHAEMWLRNLASLSQHFDVYAVDMLGHGLTDAPRVRYEIPDFVNHLIEFFDAAGLERVHLVGNSLGGWVASWLALIHPKRVYKLVLECSASFKPEDNSAYGDVDGLLAILKLAQAAIAAPSLQSFYPLYRAFLHNPAGVPDPLLHELAEVGSLLYQLPDKRQAAVQMLSELTFEDFTTKSPGASRITFGLTRQRLNSLKVPTCVLWAEFNTTMPVHVARQAQELIPDSTFELVKDCGHWPHFEKPELFNQIVGDFLAA